MTALATMGTPAVLLLANAMLILSTIHRLQAILARIRESEETIRRLQKGETGPSVDAVRWELRAHGRRVGLAHRALFSFYSSAAAFLIMIGSLGASALGWANALPVALVGAFVGAVLILMGAGLLIAETWVGVRATDARVRSILERCE